MADDVALIAINHRNMRHFTAAVTWLVRILFKKKGLGNVFSFLYFAVLFLPHIVQVKRLSECSYNCLLRVIIRKCFFLKDKNTHILMEPF